MINPDAILMHVAAQADAIPEDMRARLEKTANFKTRQHLYNHIYNKPEIDFAAPVLIHTIDGPVHFYPKTKQRTHAGKAA